MANDPMTLNDLINRSTPPALSNSLPTIQSRQEDRDRLAADVQAFLQSGGGIQQVGTIVRSAEEVSRAVVQTHMRLNNVQYEAYRGRHKKKVKSGAVQNQYTVKPAKVDI